MTNMENLATVIRVAVVIAGFACALIFSWILFPTNRESRNFYPTDGCDCRRHCEWQLTKMNETFNTLISVCEEKLQKLHSSDMNMAIIREQLHKEILELFSYEFQTFQRLHNTKADYVPQLCSDYCTAVDLTKYKDECKENATKLLNANQRLSQRQRWLRLQLKLRLRRTEPQIETANMFSSTDLWAVTVPITFVITIIILIRGNKDKLATLETERERIEIEVHTLRERNVTLANEAQSLTANLQTQQQQADEFILDKERFCVELEARNTILTAQQEALFERNGMLEYWNETLYTETTELQFEIDKLWKNLGRKETALQNAHKFWQRQQSKERKARQEFEEELENTINSLKKNRLKREWKLANGYQEKVNELETKMTCMNESYGKQLQNRAKRQKELEANVRALERERTKSVNELEKWKMRYDVEREGKRSAQEQVSSLEREVTALKAQTARLEEGLQTRSYRSSRPLRFLRQPQTLNSVEILDSRLDDMRKEFETRFVRLQSKFDSELTRDSEELHKLRVEHEELRKDLELANKLNSQLQRRLARQEPVQPLLLNNQRNKRSSHAKCRVHLAKEKLQKQISFSRIDDCRTQPEPTHLSTRYYGNTEYRLSDSGVCQ